MHCPMNRRAFLKNFTLISTMTWAPSFLVRGIKAAQAAGMAQALEGNPNRILLVIELAGGCDGLNTVVPFTNDKYYAARPTLRIDPADILRLNDQLGFHPALTGLKDLYDQGRVALVQGVGYPNPNRSHFRSRDIWHTAEPDEIGRDGWLAKFLDGQETTGLQAVNIGGRVPKAMISESGSSPSIQNIDTYQLQTDARYPEDAANKNAAFQSIFSEPQNTFSHQEYVTQTVLDATISSVQLLEGKENYQSLVTYPDTAFATNLKTIAQIISAHIGIKVFYATLGGFDTHADQIVSGDSLVGRHTVLLETFSSAVKAFYEDMRSMGKENELLIMTFSEFGRRLSENGSLGTDHGTANQMFLLGGLVNSGIFGDHPSLEASALDPGGDMLHNIDFRSVYASVLASWLGADPLAVIGEDWPLLPILL
ncbi:MAG: DUF1501 domain-containing protein [Acidobacteriota bacterium]